MNPTLRPGAWTPTIHASLTRLLAQPPSGRLAVFDWDDTVIAGDISYALLSHMERSTDRPLLTWYHHMLETQGRLAAYPQITRWFAGYSPASFEDLARGVVGDALAEAQVAWRAEVVELIAAMQATGWAVWVVTASPAVVVREIAGRIGIPARQVIGMDLELGADGRFVDRLIEPCPMLEGKLTAILHHIGRPPDFCAGDSRSDATMMAASGHALLIDAGDADLRAEAHQRGWWVQSGWPASPPEPSVRTASEVATPPRPAEPTSSGPPT